jgi:hypothetical protein
MIFTAVFLIAFASSGFGGVCDVRWVSDHHFEAPDTSNSCANLCVSLYSDYNHHQITPHDVWPASQEDMDFIKMNAVFPSGDLIISTFPMLCSTVIRQTNENAAIGSSDPTCAAYWDCDFSSSPPTGHSTCYYDGKNVTTSGSTIEIFQKNRDTRPRCRFCPCAYAMQQPTTSPANVVVSSLLPASEVVAEVVSPPLKNSDGDQRSSLETTFSSDEDESSEEQGYTTRCPAFHNSSNLGGDDASRNYQECFFTVCSGFTVKASACSLSSDGYGGRWLRLYDIASGVEVASADDDDCRGNTSQLSYTVIDSGCRAYSLHQGCQSLPCGARTAGTQVTVTQLAGGAVDGGSIVGRSILMSTSSTNEATAFITSAVADDVVSIYIEVTVNSAADTATGLSNYCSEYTTAVYETTGKSTLL